MELAVSWELAARTPRGLPDAVSRVLDMHPSTRDAQLLFGMPEHLVPLRGPGCVSPPTSGSQQLPVLGYRTLGRLGTLI